MDYLTHQELSALIVAFHCVTQRQLPVVMFGAGLPQFAALSGDAKSDAERLFRYCDIGDLYDEAAAEAIEQPVIDEGEAVLRAAFDEIINKQEVNLIFCKNEVIKRGTSPKHHRLTKS
jgi:hypothetical protein